MLLFSNDYKALFKRLIDSKQFLILDSYLVTLNLRKAAKSILMYIMSVAVDVRVNDNYARFLVVRGQGYPKRMIQV